MAARSLGVQGRMITVFLVLVLLSGIAGPVSTEDFTMVALSGKSAVGRKAFVLLSWNEAKDAEGYNLYRKTRRLDAYPEKPINAGPISVMTDCDAIKSIITRGSDELRALSVIRLPGKDKSPREIRDLADPVTRKGLDPCTVLDRLKGTAAWEQLQFLARRYYKIAQVIGQAYMDNTVSDGTGYWYEVRGIRRGREFTLVSDIHIVAGMSLPLPAPVNVQAVAGDNRVLVTWDPVDNATGYNVHRKTLPGGLVEKVNGAPVVSMITQDLDDNPITPAFGFIDYRRWDDATGMPLTHDVDGSPVAGPANGTDYRYQVAAINSLDQPGDMSAFTPTVTPSDKTPPGLPIDLKVEAVGQTLDVTWTRVEKDKFGHRELDGIKGYDIYRSETQSDMSPVKINTTLILQPALSKVTYIDSDPAIQSLYGEKEFYYRIKCIDNHNNVSVLSSAASGHVDDIHPPDIPKYVEAAGHEKYIRILWQLNSEPDIESYVIYRSLCHLGEWHPPRYQEKTGIDCGPFAMIGEITHSDAEDSAMIYGKAVYDDYTVPAGSPLCYAYWVKARDGSQNLSGDWPYPSPAEMNEIVCERLRDKTPPPPPVVAAVQARDNAIFLEWISAPSQDLHAFHVYRSEKEGTDYKWIGGITVEEPPALPVLLGAPYTPAAPAGCDEIPLVPHEGMNAGSFLDKDADAKIVYWFKIAAIDKDGNETALDELVPYSTFTFKRYGPDQPEIISITKTSDQCGLEISWIPVFDAAEHKGYIVYRGPSKVGVYRQISPLVKEQPYIDKAINDNVTYWYKMQAIGIDGRPSKISFPKKASY